MSEASETMQSQYVPVVGNGSEKGPRWFVSRYPELTITMEPETKTISGDTVVIKKAKRLTFTKQAKPNRLIGRGQNETGNEVGDRNQSRLWGVLFVKGESAEDERILAYLRAHEYTSMTTQDNEVESNPLLKELTFNPAARDAKLAETVPVHRRHIPEPGDANGTEGAPEDGEGAGRPKARVGVSKKK